MKRGGLILQCSRAYTGRRVLELLPVLGSQPAGDVNNKPDGRLPLLSARPAVTPATLKRAATRDRGIMRLCARIILRIIGDLPHNLANPA